MILIDTSIWIDFFNHPKKKTSQHLKTLIEDHAPLCINPIIEMEILQGVREDDKLNKMKKYLVPFSSIDSITVKHFNLAVDIYRQCRKKGLTVRKSTDCLIAAHCILDELAIFHTNRDFDQIKKCFDSLTIYSL